MHLPQQAFGIAGADAVALRQLDANLQRPAAGRGLGRLGAVRAASRASVSATAPACSRTSPNSTTCPSSSRSSTPARGWTTSTSTRWPASSATRRRSTRAPCAELERALSESGYLKRGSDGELRLSPKAMRQLGKALLTRRRRPDVGPSGRARPAARGRGRRALRREPGVGLRRHRAVGRDPHGHQRRRCARSAEGGDARSGVRLEVRRHRGRRDRGAHPGGGRAAGRHVVLDGDGRPLGADEAHRAGAAPR